MYSFVIYIVQLFDSSVFHAQSILWSNPVPESLEMVVEVYWQVTNPMELHYQFEVKSGLSFYWTFFRKKLTDIKGISDQKADKIQSEEIVNDLKWRMSLNET